MAGGRALRLSEHLRQKIGSIAWGVVGFTVNLIVTIIVSLATSEPPKQVQELVERIRVPVRREAA
jgi:cation/acetate symporter